jgi:hypothetical protein
MAEKAGPKFKYNTPEEMQIAVDDFFESNEIHTMSGLAEHLGMTRMSLVNYRRRDEKFADILEKAKAKVEVFWETQLLTPKVTHGVIFALKNHFGWRDQLDLDTNNKHEHNFPKLTPEEAENARKAFDKDF